MKRAQIFKINLFGFKSCLYHYLNFSKLLNGFALPFPIYKLGIIALPHRLVMRIKRVNFGNYLSSAGQILITK